MSGLDRPLRAIATAFMLAALTPAARAQSAAAPSPKVVVLRGF